MTFIKRGSIIGYIGYKTARLTRNTASSTQELSPDCKLSGRVLTPCDQICPQQAPHLPLTAWHLEEKDFIFNIDVLHHFLTFLYFREDRKFVDMFLRVTAASSVTSLVSLWSSFDTGLCDVLPLSHTGILCSTGLKCSTGPKHSRPPTAPAGIPSDIPESGLPRSNPLWAPWKHFCCQICRHGLLEVNVIEALIFKHLPLFQHQATVVAFSGTFHASDSAEMISLLNHKECKRLS